jgi:hypothetical protein
MKAKAEDHTLEAENSLREQWGIPTLP